MDQVSSICARFPVFNLLIGCHPISVTVYWSVRVIGLPRSRVSLIGLWSKEREHWAIFQAILSYNNILYVCLPLCRSLWRVRWEWSYKWSGNTASPLGNHMAKPQHKMSGTWSGQTGPARGNRHQPMIILEYELFLCVQTCLFVVNWLLNLKV